MGKMKAKVIEPPRGYKGKGGWCAKCGHLEDENGNRVVAMVWPWNQLILYRGKWLCPEHYAMALRSVYKREWMAQEGIERYVQDEQVPWWANITSKE